MTKTNSCHLQKTTNFAAPPLPTLPHLQRAYRMYKWVMFVGYKNVEKSRPLMIRMRNKDEINSVPLPRFKSSCFHPFQVCLTPVKDISKKERFIDSENVSK